MSHAHRCPIDEPIRNPLLNNNPVNFALEAKFSLASSLACGAWLYEL